MATDVSKGKSHEGRSVGQAGKQILDIITSGMYSNSLMVIREYVQNAADAIDEAVRQGVMPAGTGRINVHLAGGQRMISICDNGVGVPAHRVVDELCSVGASSKAPGTSRGFRGIGRLGGIGYCEKVVFETRTNENERVSVVTWDAGKLRNECRSRDRAADALHIMEDSVSLSRRVACPDEGSHFFRITMEGVHRFHRDDLMSVKSVHDYLGQVAPVSFHPTDFPFAEKVDRHLSEIDGYRTYILLVNDQRVYRPHAHEFAVSGKSLGRISGVELIELHGREGQSIGRGWYAKTGYLASIPSTVKMRGVRVRQGNIEIGDEHFLADYFTERRFATWHVGEIHVNYNLRANARRDGFEQSPDYEAFLEQATLLGRHLSHLCRIASKTRSRRVFALRTLAKAETVIHEALFPTEEHLRSSLAAVEAMLSDAEHSLQQEEDSQEIEKRIAQNRRAIGALRRNTPLLHTIIDGRSLRHVEPKELVASIAQAVLDEHDKHSSAESLVRAILSPYLKPAHVVRLR
jgi:hypothetical protein